MTIDAALMISGVSVAFVVYQGITNINRNKTTDNKNEASQLTMVIVKLENIGNGITDIKNEMSTVKKDAKEDRERLVKVEESTKSAHKRVDMCERYCKRFNDTLSIEDDLK